MSPIWDGLGRRWPWALALLGALTVTHYAKYWGRSEARVAYMDALRRRTVWDSDRLHHALREAGRRASRGEMNGARRSLDLLRARTDLSERERRQIEVVDARLALQFDGAPESALTAFLSSSEHRLVWELALEQLIDLKQAQYRPAEIVAIWEDLVDGRLRHPSFDAAPFPYAERFGSRMLAEHHLEHGDGVRAHAWARRLKFDYECDFDAPCGAWFSADFHDGERLLEASAALAGWTYEKEPWDDAARARKTRRMYGPPWYEVVLGVLAGVELAFLGIRLLSPRAPLRKKLPLGWGVFWRRRGTLARVHLGLYLALVLSGLLAMAPRILRERSASSGQDAPLLLLLSLAYVAVLVPFLGGVLAKPASGAISSPPPAGLRGASPCGL